MIDIKGGYTYDPETRFISGYVENFYLYDGADTSLAPVTPLMIDKNASKAEVQKAMNQLISVKGRRGMSGPVDYLKMLGALRLLRSADHWEGALKHAMKHRTPNGFAPSYASQEQWSRAKTAALKNAEDVMLRLI